MYMYVHAHVLHSSRLFCSGVPVSTILVLVLMRPRTMEREDFEFLMMCPSSQIITSGPGSRRYCANSSRYVFLRMFLPLTRLRYIS